MTIAEICERFVPTDEIKLYAVSDIENETNSKGRQRTTPDPRNCENFQRWSKLTFILLFIFILQFIRYHNFHCHGLRLAWKIVIYNLNLLLFYICYAYFYNWLMFIISTVNLMVHCASAFLVPEESNLVNFPIFKASRDERFFCRFTGSEWRSALQPEGTK